MISYIYNNRYNDNVGQKKKHHSVVSKYYYYARHSSIYKRLIPVGRNDFEIVLNGFEHANRYFKYIFTVFKLTQTYQIYIYS